MFFRSVRTLSLTAYNRPDYLRQTVDALNGCEALDQFERVFVSIDASDQQDAVLSAVNRLKLSTIVYVHTEHLGLNANIKFALQQAFAGSQFNVHLEDDIVLSPDALRFVLWAAPQVPVVELFSRRVGEADPGSCSFHPHFNPWGWACAAEVFKRFIEPDWELRLKQVPTWDLALHSVMAANCLQALRPHLSRSKHIGRTGTTQMEAYFDQHLASFNFCASAYSGAYRVV